MYPDNDFVLLDANDKGVAYVRNFCLEHARSNGHEYHWQLDDNIKKFMTCLDGNTKTANPYKSFRYIEAEVAKYSNVAAACFSHQAFAWSNWHRDVAVNQMMYCCMLIRTSVRARFKHGTAEDVDFSVRMLMEGWCTIQFWRHLIMKPQSGSQRGGCSISEYAVSGREKRNKTLESDWPEWFEEYKDKHGKSRVKQSQIWKMFYQRLEPVAKVSRINETGLGRRQT